MTYVAIFSDVPLSGFSVNLYEQPTSICVAKDTNYRQTQHNGNGVHQLTEDNLRAFLLNPLWAY